MCVFFVVQMRGGSVCSHWLRPQMAMRSSEGEYNLHLCFKVETDRVEIKTEVSFRTVNESSSFFHSRII